MDMKFDKMPFDGKIPKFRYIVGSVAKQYLYQGKKQQKYAPTHVTTVVQLILLIENGCVYRLWFGVNSPCVHCSIKTEIIVRLKMTAITQNKIFFMVDNLLK